jgi:starvation-inducible DNA-binding protein
MTDVAHPLSVLLADTYALYLKTQNYHWHVTGPQFQSLHALFEMQYRELAEAVDEVAERLVILGHHAPATFKEYEHLKTIKDGVSHSSANQMVTELAHDHGVLVKDLNQSMVLAQKMGDEGTVSLLANRISAHEKARWMLSASCQKQEF